MQDPTPNVSRTDQSLKYMRQLENQVRDQNVQAALSKKRDQEGQKERDQLLAQLKEQDKIIRQLKQANCDLEQANCHLEQELQHKDEEHKHEVEDLKENLEVGEQGRRELSNLLQSVRGPMRVYCRIKPLQTA